MNAPPPLPESSECASESPPGLVAPGKLSMLLEEIAHFSDRDLPETPGCGLDVGSVVGRFELLRELGRGGFGVVYEARDAELRRLVAFKVIRHHRRSAGDPELWVRQEAEATAQLAHPNIVTLYDVGRCASGPYLIFELLHGKTLQDRLREGPLDLTDALDVATDVARALEHAHGAGVMHRDLKPSNVFLTDDGRVKVLDFGLAHIFAASAPRSGGTPPYMAPEQWRGGPEDARADVFSAAVMLFEMLTGAPPFEVRDGRSTALDPGPPPALEVTAAPRALAALVASALSKDPAGRPASAAEWLEGLVEVRGSVRRSGGQAGSPPRAPRGRARTMALSATLAVAVLAAAALAVRSGWIPRGAPATLAQRIPITVTDFANETGERDLDSLSGMLITSLEQSARLNVLTRTRMFDLLRQTGNPDPDRIDERLGREIGKRAGARALLVATIRRFEGLYAIEVRAIDPARDESLFALKEQASGKAAVPALIDRISERARRALDESEADVRAARVHVADATTRKLDAYYQYFLGVQCLDRPAVFVRNVNTCSPHFEKAIAIDPEFALAHYGLSRARELEVLPLERRIAAITDAMRFIERAPPKERLYILAWNAHLSGKSEEAHTLYRRILETYPDEKDAVFFAGDVLFHEDQFERALPFLERLLELDPLNGWALDHVAGILGWEGDPEKLRARVREWEALPAQAPVLHALSFAHGALGEYGAAADAARRSLAAGSGGVAEQDLMIARLCGGDYAAVEEDARRMASRADSERFEGIFWLALAWQRQGRVRDALRLVDELPREGLSESDELLVRNIRAGLLVARGDAARLEREARWLVARDPIAAGLAVDLAYLGAFDAAQEIATKLRPGSSGDRMYRAVLAWKQGDAAGARDALAALAKRTPVPLEGGSATAPSIASLLFYLGEISADAGDHRGAVAALRRFRSMYLPAGWSYGRALYLAAVSHARLGEIEEARERLDELLVLLRRADPDLPLLRDARALRRELERGVARVR